ncbi:MAG: hypothetical protein KA140_04465 [Caldisericia bacterium]|nr:hypothetical protein [Caldisericia bacterium]
MTVNVLRNEALNCFIMIFKGSPGSFVEVKEIIEKLGLITRSIGERRYLILNFSSMDLGSEYLKFFFENIKCHIDKNVIDWCTVSEKPSEDYISKVFHYSMKRVRPVFRSVEQAQTWVKRQIAEVKKSDRRTRKTGKSGEDQ